VRGRVGGTLRSCGLRLRAPNKPVYTPAGGRLVPPLELTKSDKLGLLQPPGEFPPVQIVHVIIKLKSSDQDWGYIMYDVLSLASSCSNKFIDIASNTIKLKYR